MRATACSGYLVRRGFAYLTLLILVAVLGLVSATLVQLGAIVQRRIAEAALLEIGVAFGEALESYHNVTPAGQPDAPLQMQDLLRDPRFPGLVRHLRRVYSDPITGKDDWGVVIAKEDHRIIGIYSRATARPIKIGNFDSRFVGFAGKSAYADWQFLRMQPDLMMAAIPPAVAGKPDSAPRPALIKPRELSETSDPVPATTTTPATTLLQPSGFIRPANL